MIPILIYLAGHLSFSRWDTLSFSRSATLSPGLIVSFHFRRVLRIYKQLCGRETMTGKEILHKMKVRPVICLISYISSLLWWRYDGSMFLWELCINVKLIDDHLVAWWDEWDLKARILPLKFWWRVESRFGFRLSALIVWLTHLRIKFLCFCVLRLFGGSYPLVLLWFQLMVRNEGIVGLSLVVVGTFWMPMKVILLS